MCCISAAMVAAYDARRVLGSYFHERFPDGLARWKLCKVHKKLWGLTATSLREVPWEGRIQPVKSRLLIPGGSHLGVQEGTMKSAAATDPKTPQRCHAPWYQLKWLPQLQGTELAGAETSPTQHNWVFWGSAGNTVKSTLLQRKPAGVPSFCPSAANNGLSGFVCALWVKPDPTASCCLVGIGLMPRWGQGAGPQSKRCGCYYRKFASCFLFTCPPTGRVPLEHSLPHCIFKFSYVPTHTLMLPHTS